MLVEILTFEGCPNRSETVDRVRRALSDEQIIARIDEVDVATPDAAAQLKFLGSPSVRINGRDVEPGAPERSSFGLMCRTYTEEGHVGGAPSLQMIRKAIRLQIDESAQTLT